jgi:hypothetical protein
MSDTSIKKRIEKLLRLAESSNPHEAELATKKAEALMVQWGIEAAELDAKGEISEKVVEIHRYYTTNSRAWAPFVHSVCVGLGNLKALKLKMGGSKVRMYLIGHESDVDRAQMLLNSLEIQAERALAAWWSAYPDKAWIPQGQWYKAKHQFLMSFGEEVRRPLAEPREPEPTSGTTASDQGEPSVDEYEWVACSITEFGHVGRERHLAKPGSLTTKCGHSASLPGIWRKNTTKPKCKTCDQ